MRLDHVLGHASPSIDHCQDPLFGRPSDVKASRRSTRIDVSINDVLQSDRVDRILR